MNTDESTARLQNYQNNEELPPAKDNGYISARYTGKTPALRERNAEGELTEKGKKGDSYFNVYDDTWYFRPVGAQKTDWFRVSLDNLKFL